MLAAVFERKSGWELGAGAKIQLGFGWLQQD